MSLMTARFNSRLALARQQLEAAEDDAHFRPHNG
jgi:hypothetical protein